MPYQKMYVTREVDVSSFPFSDSYCRIPMFQPKYTMMGLEVQDKMKSNGTLHTRYDIFSLKICCLHSIGLIDVEAWILGTND